MSRRIHALSLLLPTLLFPAAASAGRATTGPPGFTDHWIGIFSIAFFIAALLLVVVEEFINLRKSKPVLLSAGLIWALIAWAEQATTGVPAIAVETALRHNLLQYAELMLILLVVMTYVNAMSERQLFASLNQLIRSRMYSYRVLFWAGGMITFLLSPFLNNLAATMIAGAIVVALGGNNGRFIALACTNIVIAANAGGVFSPFGDITTLMAWQADIEAADGALHFGSFFKLIPAALASYLIPTVAMHFAVPAGGPPKAEQSGPIQRRGAKRVVILFLMTIATAVFFRGALDLPAVIGMLTGLSYLQLFGYYLKRTHGKTEPGTTNEDNMGGPTPLDSKNPFDIFTRIARSEWDTLLFLYGVAMSVAGLAYLGYLQLASNLLYGQMSATTANISLGLMTALLEDIPTMYGVLAMMPDMPQAQWLLATLAIGTGGSILSIGSAAGVAMMGQVRDHYTFLYHLRWTPAILLGYICGIGVHLLQSQSI